MFRTLSTTLFAVLVLFFSCRRDRLGDAQNGKLRRVEYFDTTGTYQGSFSNLSYNNGVLMRTDMMSNNHREYEYSNNKLVAVRHRLIGVPYPIFSHDLKYSPSGQLEMTIMKGNGSHFGLVDESDTTSFIWDGPRLLKVNSVSYTETGARKSGEQISYIYTGDNITKCILEERITHSWGDVVWKDSAMFEYDNSPNLFSENGLNFFLEEFRFINLYHNIQFRTVDDYTFHASLDPAFLPFILSRNRVVTMKTWGGHRTTRFKYIFGSGAMANKLSEIRINDRLVSRYSYWGE